MFAACDPSLIVADAHCSVGLVSHLLDSIEPWCICVHLKSPQTYTGHDRKQNMGEYVWFSINLVVMRSKVND